MDSGSGSGTATSSNLSTAPSNQEREIQNGLTISSASSLLPIEELMRRSSPVPARRPPSPLDAVSSRSQASPLQLRRPRSNPRNRTPMRYESPLNADAFRRDRATSISEEPDEEAAAPRVEGRRITIRPFAGSAVGTTVPIRVREDRDIRPTPARSRKQGPSQRKVRRWNNENFVNLSSEIAKSAKGHNAAEVLLKASTKAELVQYKSILDPSQHQSVALSRFMNDDDLKLVRERFFQGEIGPKQQAAVPGKQFRHEPKSPEEMLSNVDSRLRNVMIKACANSLPACKAVNVMEQFLIDAFRADADATPTSVDWGTLLVESPIVSRQDDSTSVRFIFDADSSTGGFHRLLLHGLCQFHGLHAAPTSGDIREGKERRDRVLTASKSSSGKVDGPDIRFVDFVTTKYSRNSDLVGEVAESMSTLKVS